MALSNKICNPTPFDQELTYSQGVVVKIPSDGYAILNKHQMDDFDETQPGYEETRQILETKGLFLEDPNRAYDAQAVAALRLLISAREERIKECVNSLQKNMMEGNLDPSVDSPQFQERLRMMGISGLQKQVDLLRKREAGFRKALGDDFDNEMSNTTPRLDPERTCFVLDPPREFASKTALNIYLEEHADIRILHEQFLAAQESGDDDEQQSF